MAIYRRNILEGSSLRIIYNFVGVYKGLQTQCREWTMWNQSVNSSIWYVA